jgi:replicative DNA helicase
MNFDLYNLNFERAILSSIIFNPEQLKNVSDNLTREHFYLPSNQFIYDAMIALTKEEKPIDEEFLKQKLERAGQFDEEVMLNILSANPIANINAYIDELSKYKDRRNLIQLSTSFKVAAGSEDPILAAKELILALENSMRVNKRLPRPVYHEDIKEEEADFILKEWLPIPTKTVSLITAPGGSGKTWTVLQIAVRYCMEDKNKKVFLWLSEDPLSLSKARLNKICTKVLKTSLNDFKIHLADDSTPQLLNLIHNKITVDPIWHDLKKVFDNYDLIILDPLIAFFGGDENNNGHARFFMQLFTEYASKHNKTIIFIHHSTKNTTGSRGAGAFVDAVRIHYELDKIMKNDSKDEDDSKSHMRSIRLAKDNYNAASILRANEIERHIFPETSQTFIEVEIDLNYFKRKNGGLR